MLNRRIVKIGILTVFLCIFLSALNYADDTTPRNARIDWESVEGAVMYRVRIADEKNNNVLDKTTETNYIKFSLPPGKYKISIGALNKFYKVDTWSDWSQFEIVKSQPKPPKTKYEPLQGYSLRIGIGSPYFMIMSDWNEIYNDSYIGVTANAGYRLGKINFIGNILPLRFSGLEIDTTFVNFKYKKAFNRIESDLNNLMAGGNIFFITNFNFPVNLLIRGGGGLVYTRQNYQKYNTSGEKTTNGIFTTIDPYYKAGVSGEYCFYKDYYMELGADYYVIKYLVKDFTSLKFFVLLGLRI